METNPSQTAQDGGYFFPQFQDQRHLRRREYYVLLVWPVLLAQVLPRPQLIFPSKTCFWNLFEFSAAETT